MKLEALNGNILPIVKVTQEEKSVAEDPQDAHEDEELPEVIEEEEASDMKKKKQTRKKRSLNWEEAERGLLLEVIKPKVDYVENRNVDAKSIKAKRLAWLQITKQFNALNFRHRSLEQIQVQWRSMKNTAKREYQSKHPKGGVIEGMDLLDFMEEMQKEPVSTRSQTRAPAAAGIKKDHRDIDEDTPLAALPSSGEESSLQTQAAVTLPSPPPTSAESQNDSQHHVTPLRSSNKKKTAAQKPPQSQVQQTSKPKRQKSQNSVQSLDITLTPTTAPFAVAAAATAAVAVDDAYKKDLFDLMKRSRLAEMDYVRREHEQKLRLQQMEQDLKLSYYRKQEELKLHQMREEHEARMQHSKLEHEMRMKAYATRTVTRTHSAASKSTENHNSTISISNLETDPN